MRRSTAKAKSWLIQQGYFNIHLFVHTHFSKDVTIDSCSFDGIASKGTFLTLFQVKSNKSISKQEQEAYRLLAKKYNCECLWFNFRDRQSPQIFSTEDSQ
jgi:hypothetical protein